MPQTLTASDIEYMKQHIHDDRRAAMIVTSAVCGVIACIAIALRVTGRRLAHLEFRADDWWIFISLVLYFGTVICFALTTAYGGGRHIIQVTDARALAIITLIAELLYFGNILSIKFSLLYLYARIFPLQWFRTVLIILGSTILAITIAALATCIFQCIPINASWEPVDSPRCVDFGRFALIMGAINIVTDFVILGLPLPVVWRLNISRSKKWLISVTFAVGGCAFIVCLIRLFFVLQVGSTSDPSWHDIPSGILSTIELCVGIIAACFPTYKPLFNRIVHGSALRSAGSRVRSHPSNPTFNNKTARHAENVKMSTLLNKNNHCVDHSEDQERLFTHLPNSGGRNR